MSTCLRSVSRRPPTPRGNERDASTSTFMARAEREPPAPFRALRLTSPSLPSPPGGDQKNQHPASQCRAAYVREFCDGRGQRTTRGRRRATILYGQLGTQRGMTAKTER